MSRLIGKNGEINRGLISGFTFGLVILLEWHPFTARESWSSCYSAIARGWTVEKGELAKVICVKKNTRILEFELGTPIIISATIAVPLVALDMYIGIT